MDTPALGTRWFQPARLLLAALVLSSFIGCDQATKFIATRTLKDQPRQTYWAGTVRLEYALNSGGFLSLGGNLSPSARWWIFVGCNLLLTGGLLAYLLKHRHMSLPMYVALIAIIAGGLGNLIDRIFNQGLVTDFINVGVGPLRTGIFNVADVAITGGAIIVLILSLLPARAASHSTLPSSAANHKSRVPGG